MTEIIDIPIELEDGSIETYCFHMIELKRKEEPSPLNGTNTSGRKLLPVSLKSLKLEDPDLNFNHEEDHDEYDLSATATALDKKYDN